jgi:hypothetical protein
MDKEQRIDTIVTGVLFVALGVAIFGFTVGRNVWSLLESFSWKAAQGTIIESDVDYATIRGTTTSKFSSRSHKISTNWYITNIKYEYDVSGKKYINDRYDFFPNASTVNENEHYRKIRKYPEGKQVTIFYNLNDPQKSTLRRSIPLSWTIMYMLLSSLPLLLGWSSLKSFMPDKRQKRWQKKWQRRRSHAA